MANRYRVSFQFEHGFTIRIIEARDAPEALKFAHAQYDADEADDLRCEAEHYDDVGHLQFINVVIANGAVTEEAEWKSIDESIKEAAGDLFEALNDLYALLPAEMKESTMGSNALIAINKAKGKKS